jgi:uncharacterized delta-60 repeat protein
MSKEGSIMTFGGSLIREFKEQVFWVKKHKKICAVAIRYGLSLAAIMAFLGFWQTGVQAADGDLDQSFGNGGTMSLAAGAAGGQYLQTQSDGKIIVVSGNNIVMRFDAQGHPDSSFGAGGQVSLPQFAISRCVAVQPDGKIVIGGVKYAGSLQGLAVARLNADGSVDTSFGEAGVSPPLMFGGNGAFASAIVLQPDGKIVVSGEVPLSYHDSDFAVVRFNANGSPDQSFGVGGAVQTAFSDGKDEAYTLALQPDGKIIVAGDAVVSRYSVGFALARYNSDGTLDIDFGGTGKVTAIFDLTDNYDRAKYISVKPDGKILAVGVYYTVGSDLTNSVAIARFNRDGSLDASYGSGGKVKTAFPFYLKMETAIEQPDGKIIIGGRAAPNTYATGNFGLGRLNADGTVDRNFGTNGEVMTDFGSEESAFVVALQRSGEIILSGSIGNSSNTGLAAYKNRVANFHRTPFDFDGDGRADVSVYRGGTWHLQQSSSGYGAVRFGLASDNIAPADYDGDGKTDVAVFRASEGNWYCLDSSSGAYSVVNFGLSGDIPVAGDYDGDGRADYAVFRPSTATWWIRPTSNPGNYLAVRFGLSTDKPVAGDYDGDGKTDEAVYRDGTWYVLKSSGGDLVAQFGLSDDKPVAADYDADGRADLAVWRSSNGTWYVLQTSNSEALIFRWGATGDIPEPADYDGDGQTDFAVFRGGQWWIWQSATENYYMTQFGISDDLPIPSAFVR